MCKILSLLVVVLLSVSAFAGLEEDITKMVGDNATSYIHPLTNAIGIGMNSAWYNSSKSYSFLKIPFGLQIYAGWPITSVSDNLKTYTFKGSVAVDNVVPSTMSGTLKSAVGGDSLRMSQPGASTFVGPKTGSAVTFKNLLRTNLITPSDTAGSTPLAAIWSSIPNDTVLVLPGGKNWSSVPAIPPIGVNIGLPFKAQLGIRWIPPLDIPDVGTISQLGIKAQYEFTQWLPVIGKLPTLHTSAMYAFNNANFFDMLTLNNWTTMVNASADFKFLIGLGVYGGVGIESSTMKLDYTVKGVKGMDGIKVDLEDEGDNFFKALIGARFSFAVFDLMADATFGETTSIYVGLALGLNGL